MGKTGAGTVKTSRSELLIYLAAVLFGGGILVAVTTGRLEIVGLVILLPSLIWLGGAVWQLLRDIGSRNWLAVEGTIVSAEVRQYRFSRNPGRVSAPYMAYRYKVEGKIYEGGPAIFGKTGPPETILEPYPPGKAITVYYDPRHPERSRLRRGNDVRGCLRLVPPLVLIVIGVIMICQ